MKQLRLPLSLALIAATPTALADYKDDLGYTALVEELGSAMPTGAQVKVTQAEASTSTTRLIYAPDTANTDFAGKTFTFPGTPSTGVSSHATGVGRLFYGNASMAPGIKDVSSYEAIEWIQTLFSGSGAATTAGSRIANHSWVGNGASATDSGTLLRLVDRQVERNEYLQVVGMANGAGSNPLLGSAYNVIAVGRSDGVHDRGSDSVDSVYTAGRTRPDLVAPQSTTSNATPLVSAAAALLVETGHNGALRISKGATRIPGLGTVYNAERSETVKAALMAGAERETANTSTFADLTDYRSSGHETANGLDNRFGAGQVNVYNSYHIVAGGEQDSLEDGGVGIAPHGFDYDPAFGGASGSNDTATYRFTADSDRKLSASLAWNLGISNDDAMTVTRHNLDLALFDVTNQSTVAVSASAVDNTENLWVQLFGGHQYELRVTRADAAAFSWDYALAWRMAPATEPVPVPGALWLFGSAIVAVGALARRRPI